jgi:hypothetical protein
VSDEQPEDTVARTYEYVADNLAHLYVLAAASAVLGALVQSQFGYVGVIVMVVVGALVSLAMSWFLYRKAERMNGDIENGIFDEVDWEVANVPMMPNTSAMVWTNPLLGTGQLLIDGTPMESEAFHVEPMEEIWTPKPIHEPKAINE